MKSNVQQKQQQVQQLAELMKSSKSFALFEYQGINAADVTKLRKELFKSGSKMHIIKNNIISRALAQNAVTGFEASLAGPNAILFGLEDELSIFKNLADLSKNHDFIKIKAGLFDGKFVNATQIRALAAIPGREGLYSMLLSCLTSPIRSALYAFKAVADSKQK